MAECPSPEYAKYILTSGGLTLEDPTGWLAGGHDYGEWYSLMLVLRDRMERSWKNLKSKSSEGDPGWYEKLHIIGEEVQTIRDRYMAALEPWDFLDFTQIGRQITQITSLVHDMVCVWERVDIAAAEAGLEVPDRPLVFGEKPSGSVLPWVLGIVAAFGVGFGVFHLATSRKGRR